MKTKHKTAAAPQAPKITTTMIVDPAKPIDKKEESTIREIRNEHIAILQRLAGAKVALEKRGRRVVGMEFPMGGLKCDVGRGDHYIDAISVCVDRKSGGKIPMWDYALTIRIPRQSFQLIRDWMDIVERHNQNLCTTSM